MANDFRINHINYSKALTNLENYLKYNGDVEIKDGVFVDKGTFWIEKIWEVVYSVFSSQQRAANLKTTTEKTNLLSACLTEINETYCKLSHIREFTNDVDHVEENLCALFYMACSDAFTAWNRVNSHSWHTPWTMPIKYLLGYHTGKWIQSIYPPIEFPQKPNFFPNDAMLKIWKDARATRFLPPATRGDQFAHFYFVNGFTRNAQDTFDRREFHGILEVAIYINTMMSFNSLESWDIDRELGNDLKADAQSSGMQGFAKAKKEAKIAFAQCPKFVDNIANVVRDFVWGKFKVEGMPFDSLQDMMLQTLNLFDEKLGRYQMQQLKESFFRYCRNFVKDHTEQTNEVKEFAIVNLAQGNLTIDTIIQKLDEPEDPPLPAEEQARNARIWSQGLAELIPVTLAMSAQARQLRVTAEALSRASNGQ